jgi:hypothetical protein
MADLLKRLHKHNVAVDYIEKLLAAFRDDEYRMVSDATDHESPSPHHPIPLFECPSNSAFPPGPLLSEA